MLSLIKGKRAELCGHAVVPHGTSFVRQLRIQSFVASGLSGNACPGLADLYEDQGATRGDQGTEGEHNRRDTLHHTRWGRRLMSF
jgi:hypothetical protein